VLSLTTLLLLLLQQLSRAMRMLASRQWVQHLKQQQQQLSRSARQSHPLIGL
jgi:hypothetical protein